jgi:hypothetical protein
MTGNAMNDGVGLLLGTVALVLVPICLVRRALGRADLAALYRAPAGDAWPHGMQEGDCPHWHLDAQQPTQATRRTTPRPPEEGASAELLACTADDLVVLDPECARSASGLFVQSPSAVHGRIGLAGRV